MPLKNVWEAKVQHKETKETQAKVGIASEGVFYTPPPLILFGNNLRYK